MANPAGKLMGNFGVRVDCITAGVTVGSAVAVTAAVSVGTGTSVVFVRVGAVVMDVWPVQAASRKRITTAKINRIFIPVSLH